MKKVTKYKKAFTIIEVIIATALLGVLSVFVFVVAVPLRTKTEQARYGLLQYAEAQHLTLYLNQLVSVFDTLEMLTKQDLEPYVHNHNISSSTSISMDTIIEGQQYVLFSKDNNRVLCGIFSALKSDIKSSVLLHKTVEFQCHFIYPHKLRSYAFLDSYTLLSSSTTVSIQTHGRYSQIKIIVNEYEVTAGFLPSVKQVIQ